MSTLFAIFGFNHYELLFLALIALLLFGNRLPSVMRSLGRGVVEFKRGVNSTEDDFKAVERDEERA
jgi:sec-independent protein translocase protein TatA